MCVCVFNYVYLSVCLREGRREVVHDGLGDHHPLMYKCVCVFKRE